jgi:hypothetical protein
MVARKRAPGVREGKRVGESPLGADFRSTGLTRKRKRQEEGKKELERRQRPGPLSFNPSSTPDGCASSPAPMAVVAFESCHTHTHTSPCAQSSRSFSPTTFLSWSIDSTALSSAAAMNTTSCCLHCHCTCVWPSRPSATGRFSLLGAVCNDNGNQVRCCGSRANPRLICMPSPCFASITCANFISTAANIGTNYLFPRDPDRTRCRLDQHLWHASFQVLE